MVPLECVWEDREKKQLSLLITSKNHLIELLLRTNKNIFYFYENQNNMKIFLRMKLMLFKFNRDLKYILS